MIATRILMKGISNTVKAVANESLSVYTIQESLQEHKPNIMIDQNNNNDSNKVNNSNKKNKTTNDKKIISLGLGLF